MIKIFSIIEIIDASKSLIDHDEVNKKKLITDEPILIKDHNKVFDATSEPRDEKIFKNSIPKDIENIILEAENSQITNKPTNEYRQGDLHSSNELKVTIDELVESMHKTFSKKIKKNTLKLILELREEIIFLTKNISLLENKKKEEEFNKVILKKDFFDLRYRENELKNDIKNIQTNFSLLREQNENLNLDYTLLKEQNKNLNLDYALLKEQNRKLNEEHILLKNNFFGLRKILIQLKEQTIILRNNNIKINTQLNKVNQNKGEEEKLRERNKVLEKNINYLKVNTNNHNQEDNINNLENKIKYYQAENIRISSKLVESDKRFETAKESLNELQKHKSDLIEKINSINEVIKNENIITSVFHNDLEEGEIKVIDSNKPAKKSKNDLDQKIQDLFIK